MSVMNPTREDGEGEKLIADLAYLNLNVCREADFRINL